MVKEKIAYAGLHDDKYGGMSATGRIIRDAKVFGLLSDDEDCKGWVSSRIEALGHQVNDEWDKYGCMVSSLPKELFERHQKIHSEAMSTAKEAGWDGEKELLDD